MMGQTGGFAPFGADHLAVIAVVLIGSLALIGSRAALRTSDHRLVRRAAALALLGCGIISWTIAMPGALYVPFQLCDVGLLLTAVALWGAGGQIAELAYFWGLSGSLQAIATPNLAEPFPSVVWWTFFLDHVGIVLGVVYLAASGRIHPTQRSVWRVWGWRNGYAVVAGLANWIWGTNYGFLARKPAQPSLLDYFGPWPVYIIGLEAAALVSFALCYAPVALSAKE